MCAIILLHRIEHEGTDSRISTDRQVVESYDELLLSSIDLYIFSRSEAKRMVLPVYLNC